MHRLSAFDLTAVADLLSIIALSLGDDSWQKYPLIIFGNETPLWSTFFIKYCNIFRFSITTPYIRVDI